MSEYVRVEKPFLDQLASLGWTVIDQGHGLIPSVNGIPLVIVEAKIGDANTANQIPIDRDDGLTRRSNHG